MNDHELIMLSAVRYSLGRMTYIVKVTVDYILDNLDGTSDKFRHNLRRDIEECKDYGMDCDKKKWMKLLDNIEI